MKKILIGLLALGSISAQANCYWEYANDNLNRKFQNGIMTFGVNVLVSKVAPSGIEKALELLTESIALKGERTEYYLEGISGGKFGNKLERILIEGRTDRLEKMVRSLEEEGIKVSKEEVAQALISLDKSESLCNERRAMSSSGSFVKLKTIRQIEKQLIKNFN